MRCSFRLLILVPLLACSLACPVAAQRGPERSEAAAVEFFEKQIRPLLVRRCYECHSGQAEDPGGGLRLDSPAGILRGGEHGPAAVARAPEKSLLLKAVRYTDPLLQMPPDGKLPQREIELLATWIELGLPDPRGDQPGPQEPRPAVSSLQDWWSFQPLTTPAPPRVRNEAWVHNDIDRFILARLEQQGLRPAPPAAKWQWIRRATFDLTGLPPTPDEVDAFLADDSPTAFDRVVDRLLASPHYGERWGRHWLDVVRYADTSGCNGDFPMPEAFRYRNYVIDSFNADKSYARFVSEQIAGDLLAASSDEQRFEQLVATGYLAISRRFSSLGEEFHLTLDDTVDNLGKAFLGLSISCARCHAHKFDPIPQQDYYALYGIFQSTRYSFPGTEIYRHPQDLLPLVPQQRLEQLRPVLAEMSELDRRIFETYSTMASLDTGSEKNRLRAEWKKMQQQRDEMVKLLPAFEQAYGATEGRATDVRMHLKGDPETLGEQVPRGFLQLLGGQRLPEGESGSGRRQLARWLTDSHNPLTARVIVNRVWQWHFGRALVRTPNDFGTRGEPPTHPLLLDHLARRLMASGWSLKSLHRQMMLSSSYRMACIEDPQAARVDPSNRWLWTFNRRRLDAEEIRDAILAISGTLDRSRGGRHPFPEIWKWRYSQHKPFVDNYDTRRRSVYVMQQRIRQQPYFDVFDGADTNAATGQRKVSTTPQQALFLMNSQFVHQQSDAFADRLCDDSSRPRERIRSAIQLAYARQAGDEELQNGLNYLERVGRALRAAGIASSRLERAALASYLRVVFGSNEFVFVE